MVERKDISPDPFISSNVRAPRRVEPASTSRATQPQQRMRALREKSGTQAIATGASFVTVTFGVLVFDPAVLYTADKYTIPSVGKVTGAWWIFGQVTWAGSATGTRRQLRLRKNGSTVLRLVDMQPVANVQSQQIAYLVNDPNAADFYELQVSHDNGSDLNIQADSQFGIIHQW